MVDTITREVNKMLNDEYVIDCDLERKITNKTQLVCESCDYYRDIKVTDDLETEENNIGLMLINEKCPDCGMELYLG